MLVSPAEIGIFVVLLIIWLIEIDISGVLLIYTILSTLVLHRVIKVLLKIIHVIDPGCRIHIHEG
jgi:hypothetical protein